MKNDKYYSEINIIRGIAVLLVAIGHSFPDLETGMQYPIAIFIKDFCYSFHMALFFMISGFLEGKGFEKRLFKEEIIIKFKRLMIPYFTYSFFTIFIKLFLNQYANNPFEWSDAWKIFVGISPNFGLWFLWTMFVICIVTNILLRLKTNNMILISFGIIMNIIQIFINGGYLSYFMKFFVFYQIGILIYHNYEHIRLIFQQRKNIVISFVGFILIGIVAILKTKGYLGDSLYLLTGIIGSLSLWQISIIISDRNIWIKDKLNEYGKYSYDIYLIGYYPQMFARTILDRILSLNYVIVCIFMFIFGFHLAFFISKFFIRKIKIMRKYLLGIWN